MTAALVVSCFFVGVVVDRWLTKRRDARLRRRIRMLNLAGMGAQPGREQRKD